MDARKSELGPTNNPTVVERKSARELVVTRTFDSPPHMVFKAWTQPELLKQWWAPKSMGVSLVSCEADVRTGGKYRFEFGHGNVELFGEFLQACKSGFRKKEMCALHSHIVHKNQTV